MDQDHLGLHKKKDLSLEIQLRKRMCVLENSRGVAKTIPFFYSFWVGLVRPYLGTGRGATILRLTATSSMVYKFLLRLQW